MLPLAAKCTMNPTRTTLMLALLAALLTTAPASADDAPQAQAEEGPCEAFEYSLNPPGYDVRPECISPDLDNLS